MEQDTPPQKTAAPQSPPRPVGQTLVPGTLIADKYEVLALIGSGGMGTVYRVKQVFLGKEFALKILDSHNEINVRRFQLEAQTTAQLKHPNLVEVHDFGLIDEERPYLVMDLIEGLTLGDYLRTRGALPEDEVIPLVVQVCFGLHYAHEKGVVHRDIKPGNILLTKPGEKVAEGTVKIVDFGIAKLMQAEGGQIQALTKTGEIFGSPLYMSPEQCKGTAMDHRCDIFSLGCVMYEMLTGSPPFFGETAMATMMKRLSERAPTLKEGSLGGNFSDKLESTIAKMLAAEPDDRQQKMSRVVEELTMNEVRPAAPGAHPKQKLAALKSTSGGKLLALLIAVAAVSCILTEAFDQWVFSNKLAAIEREHARQVSQADSTFAKLIAGPLPVIEKEANPDQFYPTSEILQTPTGTRFRRFHFGNQNYGKINNHDAIGTVDIPNLKPVTLRLIGENSVDVTNPKVFSRLHDDDLGQIHFSDALNVDDNTMAALSRFTKLEVVSIPHTMVTTLAPLRNLPQLTGMTVYDTSIQGDDILHFPRLMQLDDLAFGAVDNPDQIFKALQKSKAMRHLYYRANLKGPDEKAIKRLTNSDLRTVLAIPNLQDLTIRSCREMNDGNLPILLENKRLRKISLRDCGITAESIPTLQKFNYLRELLLTTDGWSEAQKKEAHATMPYFRSVESSKEKQARHTDQYLDSLPKSQIPHENVTK